MLLAFASRAHCDQDRTCGFVVTQMLTEPDGVEVGTIELKRVVRELEINAPKIDPWAAVLRVPGTCPRREFAASFLRRVIARPAE